MFQGHPQFPPNLQFQHGCFPWPPCEPPKPEEPKKPEPTPMNAVVTNFLANIGAIPPPPAPEKPPEPPRQFVCFPVAPPPPPQKAVACLPPRPPHGCPPWAIYQAPPSAPEKPKPKPKKLQAQMQSHTAVQYQYRHGRSGGNLKAPEEQWGYGQMQWGQMGMWEVEEEAPAEEEPKLPPGFYRDGQGWWYQC